MSANPGLYSNSPSGYWRVGAQGTFLTLDALYQPLPVWTIAGRGSRGEDIGR